MQGQPYHRVLPSLALCMSGVSQYKKAPVLVYGQRRHLYVLGLRYCIFMYVTHPASFVRIFIEMCITHHTTRPFRVWLLLYSQSFLTVNAPQNLCHHPSPQRSSGPYSFSLDPRPGGVNHCLLVLWVCLMWRFHVSGIFVFGFFHIA
jgi:hypothetical protein